MSTQSEPNSKGRRARFLSRFIGNRSGSTAVEFSLLAMPFAALVFAILESCISFAGQQVMANITDDIARQLRTGQIRPAALNEVTLKKMICDELEIMVATDCPGLEVDLREFPTFAEAAAVRIHLTAGQGSRYQRLRGRSGPCPCRGTCSGSSTNGPSSPIS